MTSVWEQSWLLQAQPDAEAELCWVTRAGEGDASVAWLCFPARSPCSAQLIALPILGCATCRWYLGKPGHETRVCCSLGAVRVSRVLWEGVWMLRIQVYGYMRTQ